jgi:CHAT domain-containing protein
MPLHLSACVARLAACFAVSDCVRLCKRFPVLAPPLPQLFAATLATFALHAHAQSIESNVPRTVSDITRLLESTAPDPAIVAAHRAALTAALPPEDAFWWTKRDALLKRMHAAESLGLLAERKAAAQAIVDMFRGRGDRSRELEAMPQLLGIMAAEGRGAEADKIWDDIVKDPQFNKGHWATYWCNRARRLVGQGQLNEAQSFFGTCESVWDRSPDHAGMPNMSTVQYRTRAVMLEAQGRFDEADANFQRAIRESTRWADRAIADSGWHKHALPPAAAYSGFLSAHLEYSRMLVRLGRLKDAEAVVRAPLAFALRRTGKYSPPTVLSASAYADLLAQQGRFVESELLSRAVLEIAKGIGADENSSYQRTAYRAIGMALAGQRRTVEADQAFSAAQIRLDRAVDVAVGISAAMNGRASSVLAGLEETATRLSKMIGDDNPLTAEARGAYAVALFRSGDRNAALKEFARAAPVLTTTRGKSAQTVQGLRVVLRQLILENHIAALAEAPDESRENMAQSFRIADFLRTGATQAAVAASAARASVSDPALGARVRQEQDLRIELEQCDRALSQLVTASAKEQEAQATTIANLRNRVDNLRIQQREARAAIERDFPKYADLVSPLAPTMAETQAALRKGEVLISILSTGDQVFVWALPQLGQAHFVTAKLGNADLQNMVSALRSQLDIGDLQPGDWPAFDTGVAHQLYQTLLKPVESALDGAITLIVVSNGSLASLPFGLMVTAPVTVRADSKTLFDRYRNVPWLAIKFASTQLPSVSALIALRKAPSAGEDRKPFIGFGDPVFALSKTNVAASPATRGVTGPRLRNQPPARVTEQLLRSNKRTEWPPYGDLAPLPETRDELQALARSMGADPDRDVIVGADANKARVKNTDLSKMKVVAFATHGLLPGDFPALTQPALALSAPAGRNVDRDPNDALLTLEDVLQLKLNADWVVLSACNTGAGDGLGGEAMSGLGRGFFYAGSRSLLVTHWPVETGSARELMTDVFSRYARDASLSRAQALQQGMAEVRGRNMQDPTGQTILSYAHPLFWAPYALVGEPAR